MNEWERLLEAVEGPRPRHKVVSFDGQPTGVCLLCRAYVRVL